MLIWGTRSPTLAEPLLQGTRWNSLGGAGNDVGIGNRYVGHEKVVVPAFPEGVEAAKVEAEITQAGAVGDPFGWGVAHGLVGARRRAGEDRHAPRAAARSARRSCSRRTSKPLPLPADVNLLPLNRGDTRRSAGATAASTVTVTVRRTGSLTASASVTAATVAGSALVGSDFVAKTQTLLFAAGVASVSFVVSIVNNTTAEPLETFSVALSAPSSGTSIADGTGVVTITDNDGALLATAIGGRRGRAARRRRAAAGVHPREGGVAAGAAERRLQRRHRDRRRPPGPAARARPPAA